MKFVRPILTRGVWLAAWLMLATEIVRAEPGTPAAMDADQSLASGLALQQQAELAPTPAEAIRDYEQAIAQYRQATQVRPDFYNAHAMWSVCLLNLALKAADPEQRWHQVQAARDRFAVAARCPGVDWKSYQAWAGALISKVDRLASGLSQRRLLLTEASKACAAGLPLARFAKQRAELKCYGALCRILLAKDSTDPAEQRALYEQALAGFQSVTAEEAKEPAANFHDNWGSCLMGLSKLTKDRALLQQAVEQFQTSAQLESHNANALYNLGCTYALLDQSDEAIRHLHRALEQDRQGTFQKALQQDRDLDSLRSRADFQALLATQPGPTGANGLYAAGAAFQHAAEHDVAPVRALSNYEKAIEQYRRAVEADPGFYQTQFMWARCLMGMINFTSGAEPRRRLLQDARDRFAAAARCPNTDSRLYSLWGKMLYNDGVQLAATAGERRQAFRDAQTIFETGLSRARLRRERANLECDLGTCLVLSLQNSPDLTEKRDLARQAIVRFGTATKLESDLKTAETMRLWGMALMELGKLDKDRLKIRQAIDQLETSAKLDPNNSNTQFNLACCFALINEPEAGLRHLRICLFNDPKGTFHNEAVQDADLRSLRSRREFDDLVRGGPDPNPGTGKEPPLSGR